VSPLYPHFSFLFWLCFLRNSSGEVLPWL
jgi:hypothetical protein